MLSIPTTEGALMATHGDLDAAKLDAMVALLKSVEEAAKTNKSGPGYDGMLKTALAYRYIAGGEQPS